MAVSNQIPRNVSVATPGATVFPYNFKVTRASDLLVRVNGVTKSLGVHYTVDGVGQDSGGNITFLTPMTGGESVMRRRNMEFTRGTDYQNLGDLRSATLNNDQDEPILMIQQIGDQASRALRIGDDDLDGSGVYDANGNRLRGLPYASTTDEAAPLGQVLDRIQSAVSNPNTELFLQDGGGTQPRTVSDVLRKDIMFSVSNTIPLSHSGDVRALIQASLNDAATSARAGRREVAFRARGLYQISNFLTVPSGTRLIFDGDGRMMPTTSSVDVGTGNGLRSYGSLPVTTYAPAADIAFGEYKIPAGVYAGLFAVGDYVWLGSSLVIATSPNTQNVTRAQMAKVIAVDGSDLILDRMIEYDFPAATSTFGKADIVSGVRVENFVWGDPAMDIVSGRGIDFRFHDDLKIIGSDIGWSRDTPQLGSAYDKQNVNAINLSCCSNVEIDGLRANRVGWYGVSLNGACHNVRVRGLDARMVRHGLSLNWNGPGEPINVTVEDSSASLTTEAGFDTHDVGRDITFRKLRVTGSNGPGIQARTSNVSIDDVSVDACAGSGFLVYGSDSTALARLYNVTLSKIRARSCVNGVMSLVGVKISDASISRCSGTGISTNGGSINVARIVDSNVAIMYRPGVAYDANMVPLTIRDVDAPASADQTYFLRSTKAFTDRDLKVRDVRAVGYDADKLVSRTDGTYIADIDHRGCTFGTDPRQGTVALVAGTATISNNNIVVPASETLTRVFRSNVQVQRLSAGGTVGSYTVTLAPGQIVITSSSNTDTSTVSWRII